MAAEINALRNSLIDEIIRAAGLSDTAWLHRLISMLFHRPVEQFSRLGLVFDQKVETGGFQKAAAWFISRFSSNVIACGLENILPAGPLLVISNHPGVMDFLVITAMLNREDVKIISSNIKFLKCLPNTCSHVIFSTRTNDIHKRMAAARAGIRHLQNGGALILLGSGSLDPDPEIDPHAEIDLELWSPSVDLFLRKVPETKVLITIVSGLLSHTWAHHPVTWLRHAAWRKRLLAEFGQVSQQLFFPGRLSLTPHISFDRPITLTELQPQAASEPVLPAIIARARLLMALHLDRIASGQGKRMPVSVLIKGFESPDPYPN